MKRICASLNLLVLGTLTAGILLARDFHTLSYFENDSIRLELDLFLPDSAGNASAPLLIFVHGGGFSEGEREDGHELCRHVAGQGMACASITYTLYMQGKSFSCDGELTEKVRAIRIAVSQLWHASAFLLDHAGEYGIDPGKIFLSGSSAGAEAVLHAAYWDREMMQLFGKALPDNFRYAGLVSGAGAIMDLNLITSDNMIPTFMFHGDADPTVPYGVAPHHFCDPGSPGWLMLFGSAAIADHMAQTGGTCHLVTFTGGDHSFSDKYFLQDQQYITDFLHRILAGEHFNEHQQIISKSSPEK